MFLWLPDCGGGSGGSELLTERGIVDVESVPVLCGDVDGTELDEGRTACDPCTAVGDGVVGVFWAPSS